VLLCEGENKIWYHEVFHLK